MGAINWKARFKNKWFWMTIIPLILLLVQQLAGMFGIVIEIDVLQSQILEIVETVFLLLGVLGVTVDMTTEGIGDSELALTYDRPKPKRGWTPDDVE